MDLFSLVQNKYKEALDSGALQSYMTETRLVRNGLEYIVFVLKNLSDMEKLSWDKRARGAGGNDGFDPFMPYDKDLFVGDLTDTHICLLNKYNVMKDHILIVTRSFEDQESPLSPGDFEALCLCLEQIGGLAFYNSGEKAGASQKHKHIQMVSLPLGGSEGRIPIEPLVNAAERRPGGRALVIPQFEFRHGVFFLSSSEKAAVKEIAFYLYEKYLELADYTGLSGQWGPYNLLITREWMLLIPRTRERFEGISVNSLGFAGTLLVKDVSEFEIIERAGLFKILNSVTVPL